MSAQLDHLVIGGSDLGMLVAWWKQASGVYPATGGSHDGFGTRNALIGVDRSTYVELISVDPNQPEPEQPRPFGLDDLEPHSVQLCTFVIAVPDIDTSARLMRDAGFDPGPVRSMERVKADGSVLRWQLAIPPRKATAGVQPALIQWGQQTPHPGTSLSSDVVVQELVLGLPDPQGLQSAFDALGADFAVSTTPEPMISAHFTTADGADFWL